jgi:hypothetical protein
MNPQTTFGLKLKHILFPEITAIPIRGSAQ